MKLELEGELQEFVDEKGFKGKGKLSVAVVVTQHAKERGLPLEPEALITEGGGQVLGLGVAGVQTVLTRHGVDRILAREGGRTSRGSIGNMQSYVELLNRLHADGLLAEGDLTQVERFWVERVKDFFAGQPFKLRLEAGRGLRAAVADLLEQARARQAESSGMMVVGAVMQHLVGAKLSLALPDEAIKHNSFSTSDQQSGRGGDFDIADAALHVTVTPSDALINRCRANVEAGRRPIIITRGDGVVAAAVLAAGQGLGEAVDVFDVEQFIALNLYELSGFDSAQRSLTANGLVERYNAVVEAHETDPSLRIAVQ